MNDEGLADVEPLTPFVYPDFTQESVLAARLRCVTPRSPEGGAEPQMPLAAREYGRPCLSSGWQP